MNGPSGFNFNRYLSLKPLDYKIRFIASNPEPYAPVEIWKLNVISVESQTPSPQEPSDLQDCFIV